MVEPYRAYPRILGRGRELSWPVDPLLWVLRRWDTNGASEPWSDSPTGALVVVVLVAKIPCVF